jgi:hypothetical protein
VHRGRWRGHPDTNTGIFVAKDGSDDGSCGSEDHPCLTINMALDKAASTAIKNTVYVATGIYNETVTLKPGLTIEGGWADVGGVWDRVCSVADPTQAAVVAGTTPITIEAENLNAVSPGTATLRFLNINTQAPDPGTTIYGIYADGTTSVTLDNVIVSVGHAGDGKDGDAEIAGNSPANNNCTTGTGQTPEAGAAGGQAAGPVLAPDGVISQTGQRGAAEPPVPMGRSAWMADASPAKTASQ